MPILKKGLKHGKIKTMTGLFLLAVVFGVYSRRLIIWTEL
jgi:hypothetical protein